MNRLNIFYEHIFEAAEQTGVTVEQCLVRARGFGYEGLECDFWRLSDRSETKALFDGCGFSVSSVYRMFDFPNAPCEESLKQIDECLETAAYFGAPNVLAIPGFVHDGEDRISVCERMCALLRVMCERAKTYGIVVSLEDFDDKSAPFSTISWLEYFLENVDGLRFTFDTGNFAYSLENAAEAYTRLRKYVSHVHLKDRSWDASRSNPDGSNGKADLSGRVMYPCEVGGGFIGIAQLLDALKTDGYSGSLSVEHFGAANQLEYMKTSAEFVRSVLS